MKTSLRLPLVSFAVATLVGCDHNPNVEIVGSYFPGWMISLVLGIALTFPAHAVLRRFRLAHAIGHPALIYPSLVFIFTCLIWLSFFA